MLHLQAVGRHFHGQSANRVLSGIDLDLQRGEFICLVGPSGSGKTTLLRVIAGLDKADQGQVTFPNDAPPRMSAVFQEPRLVPWLSILENLLLVSGRGAEGQARALLNQAELGETARSYPGQLSGGMQRRVALVRALLVQPDLLLLDEPLTSLDPALEGRMSELLREYWRRHRPAVVMVTHDPRQAAQLATRVIALATGITGLALDETVAAPFPGERTAQQCSLIITHLLTVCPAFTVAPSPTVAAD